MTSFPSIKKTIFFDLKLLSLIFSMPEFPGHATGKCLSGNMDEYANFQDISNFQASLFAAILAMKIFLSPW